MVHVYNCHPFASQHIVPTEQEPGPVCCGGDALFVVSAGGCKIEAYQMQEEGCPLICRFATMGTVHSILHSQIGDYLVTIEEKNKATYLRAYTNWRYQAVEKTRVGVRLLGHLLRGSASLRGIPKEQMEIIEIPLFEPPLCVSCCPLTGDLLVGCAKSLVLFTLRRQTLNDRLSVLDFERLLILHIPGWTPSQVALCAGYVAMQADLEVLVFQLQRPQPGKEQQQKEEEEMAQQLQLHALVPKDMISRTDRLSVSDSGIGDSEMKKEVTGHLEPEDFYMFPKNQEMLGEQAKDCGVCVTLEWTGVESEAGFDTGVTYILYRRFAPDFFQGNSVEDTCLHSLQLYPVFTSNQEATGEAKSPDPACVFCFFSLPNTGYMYSITGSAELVSSYQYPEKAQQAVLSSHFLHVITKNALQCFSVRCSAVAARAQDPYIDTTVKACPPYTMEVCALRIQLFIGLKALCHDRNHIVLLTAADVESKEDMERAARKSLESKDHKTLTGILLAVGIEPSSNPALESLLSRSFLDKHNWLMDTLRSAAGSSRKTSITKPKEPSESGHGWNLYVVNTVSSLTLYREMVEYSKKYEVSDPFSLSCIHLLSEAHLLLRASLLDPLVEPAERAEVQQAFRENCAQLGDCYSRFDKRDSHQALPYYKMSGLSVTEVIQRNMCPADSPPEYGKGFLFFLRHSLEEEDMEELSEEAANTVLDIFSVAEPGQLPHVVSSPFMLKSDPAFTLAHLDRLEAVGAPTVTLTLAKASLALRMGDMQLYQQQMERHAEMLQVYGFIEEPKLLLLGRGKAVVPTPLARHLHLTQQGLLVAAAVALHENNRVKLEEADLFFQELCKEAPEAAGNPQLLVDFWEALLVASSQEAVIQELLFRLTSVYIDHISRQQQPSARPLKTADDLMNSCLHYGQLYPWVGILTPAHLRCTQGHQEDLQKLQSLLCGPTLDVSSILPLLEQLPDSDNAGLSVHVLCATRLGHTESSIERLLDRCPQAIISFAQDELKNDKMALWWQKLFPELCERTRTAGDDNSILLTALKETLVVVAMELNPLEFLELLPDDGTAQFFLPHLLECSQRNLMT
ncbi:Hermansky-Pudlak syndrome 3 protein isoform X1 [Alosa sapidissima]|uniref:Hermansky-Pudlak syndrome 3 protein isoform X1 n=1 Tax=Alosa sapidissima TaxID=34773 RepID=UPI001C08375D|nr:Hermansky-Pudlak syndrome 3 protein isoform X1 [Alosa sapidissima]